MIKLVSDGEKRRLLPISINFNTFTIHYHDGKSTNRHSFSPDGLEFQATGIFKSSVEFRQLPGYIRFLLS